MAEYSAPQASLLGSFSASPPSPAAPSPPLPPSPPPSPHPLPAHLPLPPPPSRPPPPAAKVKEKVVLRGVHFDFNKYNIRPGDAAILDEAAEILRAHPNVTIYVDGYCDAIGKFDYNLKLSQKRANAVAR